MRWYGLRNAFNGAYYNICKGYSTYGAATVPLTTRSTLTSLQHKYKRGEPITAITAYDYPSAVHVRLHILVVSMHIIDL